MAIYMEQLFIFGHYMGTQNGNFNRILNAQSPFSYLLVRKN